MIKFKTKSGTVELPKLTLRLSDMTDEVEGCADNRERYRLQYDFLAEVLGSDVLAAEVEGEDLESADLVALSVAYAGIINAYATPVIESQTKALGEQVKSVKPTIEALERMQAAQSRQGFKAVR